MKVLGYFRQRVFFGRVLRKHFHVTPIPKTHVHLYVPICPDSDTSLSTSFVHDTSDILTEAIARPVVYVPLDIAAVHREDTCDESDHHCEDDGLP